MPEGPIMFKWKSIRRNKKGSVVLINNKTHFAVFLEFTLPADHRVKIKECKKIKKKKTLGPCQRTQKAGGSNYYQLCLAPSGKGLVELEISRRIESTQTAAWLTSARILIKILETKGDLLGLRFQWKIANKHSGRNYCTVRKNSRERLIIATRKGTANIKITWTMITRKQK